MKQYCLNFDDWFLMVYNYNYTDRKHDKLEIKHVFKEYKDYRHKEWRKLNGTADKHI